MTELNNLKKICIISPSLKMGGIERALTTLANYFSSLNFKVTFISCQQGIPFYQLDEQIDFIEFSNKRKEGLTGKIAFYYDLLKFLRTTVAKVTPDCVISFGDAFNPLVLLALRNSKVPIYISDRTSPDFPFNPIVKLGKKLLYPQTAGFIAQTKRAADYNMKQFDNKLNIRIIPNAIKPIPLHPEIARKNQIVYIGRFSKEKGVARLIESFSKIKNKFWTLALAGDGPELSNLKLLVKNLDLKDRVIFLGKVSRIDLLLAESSIFVLPSFLEGFPNALCEAMSAGLPSICFDSIPHEDIITNGVNGFVVKDGDLQALSLKIDELILDEVFRNKISLLATDINDKLNTEKIGIEYLNFIYNKI